MKGNISIKSYEENLINTDKLAYSLAEAITNNLVSDRKKVTRQISCHVNYYKALAKVYGIETWKSMNPNRYSLILQNKSLIEGAVKGVSYMCTGINGEDTESVLGDTFRYRTYASVKLVSGLYVSGSADCMVVDIFDTIWAKGAFGSEFTIKLTEDMLREIQPEVEQYLSKILANMRILKTPEEMTEEYSTIFTHAN